MQALLPRAQPNAFQQELVQAAQPPQVVLLAPTGVTLGNQPVLGLPTLNPLLPIAAFTFTVNPVIAPPILHLSDPSPCWFWPPYKSMDVGDLLFWK